MTNIGNFVVKPQGKPWGFTAKNDMIILAPVWEFID